MVGEDRKVEGEPGGRIGRGKDGELQKCGGNGSRA